MGRAENIPLIRVYNVGDQGAPTSRDTILILPPLGHAGMYQSKLLSSFQEEFQKYFNARVVSVSGEGRMGEYVNQQNLVPEDGFFDFEEIKRFGSIMQSEYVACIWVQEVRAYPPQVLSLYMTILDVNAGSLLIELDATFNASDQKVVVALQDYLQRRRARRFDRQNLDVMLQSPTEFHQFVAAECSRAMAQELSPMPKI